MEAPILWTFGELEAVLAAVHFIDQSKRTAFQARLKNFHRLGYPIGFKATKGKAATYSPLQIADMALAVEMTQLGLPPERVTRVLSADRWLVLQALGMAARSLMEKPEGFDPEIEAPDDPLSMFLYFDPSALNSLSSNSPPKASPLIDRASQSFFYGGIGVVRESLVRLTTGTVSRLSLINVTNTLDLIVGSPFAEGTPQYRDYREAFFALLAASADREQVELENADDSNP